MDEKRRNFVDHETILFSTQVIHIESPYFDKDRGLVMRVNSSLEIGSLFTFIAFHIMGRWNVVDAYVEADLEDGTTVYRFELLPCQYNQ